MNLKLQKSLVHLLYSQKKNLCVFYEYSGVTEPPCSAKIEPPRSLIGATPSSGESQYVHNNRATDQISSGLLFI